MRVHIVHVKIYLMYCSLCFLLVHSPSIFECVREKNKYKGDKREYVGMWVGRVVVRCYFMGIIVMNWLFFVFLWKS